jgi:pilus assembly protein CpaB
VRRRGGIIWIIAGVVLAVAAGALAFWTVFREAAKVTPTVQPEPKAKVVVATRGIMIRELIQSGDVAIRSVPLNVIPEGAAREVGEVVDRLAVLPISAGEIVLSTDVVSPTLKGEYLSLTMEETQVAMAFPARDLMSSNNLLKPGDHVDLLYTLDLEVGEEGEGDEQVTFDALENVEIATIIWPQDPAERVRAGSPTVIVFALDPQDALVLKYLENAGGKVDMVLRAPGVEEPFGTQPVVEEYLLNRYQLRIPVLP